MPSEQLAERMPASPESFRRRHHARRIRTRRRPAEGLGDAVAAGLLAYGSSPRTHLPGANPSGMLGIGYPLTVAGAAAD